MKKILVIFCIIIIILATFLGIRMANVPVKLDAIGTLTLPSFPNLTEILSTEPTISQTSAKYAVAIDDTLVYYNSSKTQPTASTAKMILALMVTEKYPLNPSESGASITITPELYSFYNWYLSHNGSTVPVQIGETISEYDALSAVLIASANNLADALAVWAFGSLSAYQDYANNRLSEWGLTDTIVGSDASGFSPDTTSTAANLALIGQKLMKNPALSQIVNLKSYTIPVAGMINNTNQLLGLNNISGIKTGYIGPVSGYCLISSYRIGEHTVTVSVLDADTRGDSFALSYNLIAALQNALSPTTIASTNSEIGYYDTWWAGKIPIRLSEDAIILGWKQSAVTNTSASPSAATSSSNATILSPSASLTMNNATTGTLSIQSNTSTYDFPVTTSSFNTEPSFWQRFLYALSPSLVNAN